MSTKQVQLSPARIARRKDVLHPALDWTEGQLIVGVVMEEGARAVLSSRTGLVPLDNFRPLCERGVNFGSSVTPEVAQRYLLYLNDNAAQPIQTVDEVVGLVATYLRKFTIFPDAWWPEVLGTWVVGTYLYPLFQAYPYLAITSPEPGCGKSNLGQLLSRIAFNGEFMVSPNESHLFRLSELNRGVQVWDETELSGDTEKRRFEAIKGVLLNGYRNGGVVPRQTGKSWENTVKYHVYCPRVFIGLSKLPDVAAQRTITLELKKRTLGDDVEHYRSADHVEEEEEIRAACTLAALRWVEGINRAYSGKELRKKLETLLSAVGRETDDIWLPLFALIVGDSPNWDEIPLFKTLCEAAQTLVARRRTSWNDVDLSKVPSPGHHPGLHKEQEVLTAALRILEWACPMNRQHSLCGSSKLRTWQFLQLH